MFDVFLGFILHHYLVVQVGLDFLVLLAVFHLLHVLVLFKLSVIVTHDLAPELVFLSLPHCKGRLDLGKTVARRRHAHRLAQVTYALLVRQGMVDGAG